MNKPFYGVASMPKSQRCRSPLIQQPSQDTTWIPQALAHTTTLKRHSMDYPNGRSKFHHVDSKNVSTKAVASKIPPSPLVLGTTAKQKDLYLSSHAEKNDRNNHFNKGIKIQKLRLKKLLSQFPQPTGLTQPQRRPFLRLPITLPGTWKEPRTHLPSRLNRWGETNFEEVNVIWLSDSRVKGFGGDKKNYIKDNNEPGPGSFEQYSKDAWKNKTC